MVFQSVLQRVGWDVEAQGLFGAPPITVVVGEEVLVSLREGRRRQIREVGSRLGLLVLKIIRVRIGTLYLGNLRPREWRHLSEAEVAALGGQSGMARAGTRKGGKAGHPRRRAEH